MRVRMHWRPEPPLLMQIDVVVAECEGLANVEQFLCFTGENDPYVRVTVNGVHKQTEFIDGGGANPKWNTDGRDGSLLPFAVSELPDVIWVRAFDQDEGSADDLIGIGKIDLSGKVLSFLGRETGFTGFDQSQRCGLGAAFYRCEMLVGLLLHGLHRFVP